MKTKTIMFAFEKATKNTARFEEQPESGQPAVLGGIYVQKWFLPSMGTGTKARVTIEIQEGGADQFPPFLPGEGGKA